MIAETQPFFTLAIIWVSKLDLVLPLKLKNMGPKQKFDCKEECLPKQQNRNILPAVLRMFTNRRKKDELSSLHMKYLAV